MSATATQPVQGSTLHGLRLLGVFGVVATVGLAAVLVTGATGAFNVLVFVLFAVLWVCFAAALALAPVGLDEFWRAYRRRSIVVQAVGWLLFLPLAAALFVWERWHVGVRLVLVTRDRGDQSVHVLAARLAKGPDPRVRQPQWKRLHAQRMA